MSSCLQVRKETKIARAKERFTNGRSKIKIHKLCLVLSIHKELVY